jgi:polyisoprenoid-binding protein YceI
MEDHFNENYMESDKYPKSIFKGKFSNIENIDFNKDGTYPATVKGTLEIHGVKKEVETTGTIKVSGKNITATASFEVTLEDYKVDVPSIVGIKISEKAKIKVNCTYTPYN